MHKILTIAKWALMLISVVLFALFFTNVVPLSDMQSQIENGTTNMFLGWALVLLCVCAVAAVAFPVVNMVANPKSAVKTIIALVVVAVIFGISYAMSSGALDSMAPTLVESDESTRLWSGAGLNALYITLTLTIVAVIASEVYAKIKK
ncbi:MAG: hypothetical protein IIU03_05260 [Bacteroidales bacterium]|nr:hypothetical protein [Bacteroidales bacterium]MBQ5539633.1 hypothetical protein [Bacteroidales bacterium]MEE3448137.1 hypothetical protein [Bacteroidales bacterium]